MCLASTKTEIKHTFLLIPSHEPNERCELTAVVAEDVWEAVQKSVSTPTVRTSFLNPFPVWNHPTVPTQQTNKHVHLNTVREHAAIRLD